MSPQQRNSVVNDSKSSGFTFSEARVPQKHHTHFLPRPLKPTLAAGCALVEGIRIISDVWLEALLAKTKAKPTASLRQNREKPANQTDKQFEVQMERLDQQHKNTALSEFEADYQTAWKTLGPPELAVKTRVSEGGFESVFKDSEKWGPNPARSTMFSDLCFVILAPDDDEDAQVIERIILASRGAVHSISPEADDAAMQSLLIKVRQARPKKCVFMRTPRFSFSSAPAVLFSDQLKASLGLQKVTTMEDLLCSIYNIDSSKLVEVSVSDSSPQHTRSGDVENREPLFRQSSMLGNEPGTIVQAGNTATRPIKHNGYSQEDRMPQVPSVVGEVASTDAELLPAPTPSTAPPRLIRRAGTRTEEVRAKELDALLSHNKDTASEIEQLKLQARIDDSTDISIAPTLINLANTNPVVDLTESNASRASVNDIPAPTPTLQLSGLATTTRKLPPKRKARAGGEIDLDKYMPFLSSADPVTGGDPAQASTADSSQELSTQASKKRRVGEATAGRTASRLGGIVSSGCRIEDFDIDKIEGPATRMMRADAEQAKNPLKRKEPTDLCDGAGEQSGSQSQKQRHDNHKKARKDTATLTAGSPNHLSAEDESSCKTTQRKKPPSRRSKPSTNTAKTKQANKDDDASEDSDQFLTIKTTGKRLTKEELQANLAFNRLRISKPPLLLQTQPIASRRIEWDEEDVAEEEIREMDGWTQEEMNDANAKSFFKVEYVNMIRKPAQPEPDYEDTQGQDSRPNFKKFKPKGQASRGHFSVSATPRNNIKLETVRLKRGGVEDWEAPKKSKEPNTQIDKGDDQEEDEEESDDNSFRKFTGKKTQVAKATLSPRVKKGAPKQSAKATEQDPTQTPPSSDGDFRPSRRRGGEVTRSLRCESGQDASSSSMMRGVAASRSTRNRSQAQTRKNTREIEFESGSEADDLAFKGFGRAR